MRRLTRTTTVSAAMFSVFVVATTIGRTPTVAAAPLTCGGLEVTIVGTAGDDVIDGTSGNDVIAGLGGNDVIRGGDGEDVICGGPGDDYIEGQGDEDIIFGDEGDDTLDGGEAGCCNFATNTGDDLLTGGPGNDVLHSSDFPQAGNTLYGDQGDDVIFVWAGGLAIGGKAHVFGGNGNDTIYQYTGDAIIEAGNGNDLIVDWDDLGAENETITMIGENGNDELISEDLTSTVEMQGGQGHDSCEAGDSTLDCEVVL